MTSYNLTTLPADTNSHATNTTTPHKKRRRPRGASLEASIEFYEDETGHWTGACDSDGYPVLNLKGKTQPVHRLIAELAGWDIEGKVVMHIDDNPLNVRLDNLRVGTQAENMADMAQKGRGHTASRFKATEIAAIVRQRKMGGSINQIAHATGRSRKAVSALLKRMPLKDSQEPVQGILGFTGSITSA
ncbi:HNH endonuclease [Acetobacter sp.]|uniref:HNH endonuclease signature motif containing protein n=1 Tax=Acetobacter sp. TaxID=440 RepID=UPI0039E967B8